MLETRGEAFLYSSLEVDHYKRPHISQQWDQICPLLQMIERKNDTRASEEGLGIRSVLSLEIVTRLFGCLQYRPPEGSFLFL